MTPEHHTLRSLLDRGADLDAIAEAVRLELRERDTERDIVTAFDCAEELNCAVPWPGQLPRNCS